MFRPFSSLFNIIKTFSVIGNFCRQFGGHIQNTRGEKSPTRATREKTLVKENNNSGTLISTSVARGYVYNTKKIKKINQSDWSGSAVRVRGEQIGRKNRPIKIRGGWMTRIGQNVPNQMRKISNILRRFPTRCISLKVNKRRRAATGMGVTRNPANTKTWHASAA